MARMSADEIATLFARGAREGDHRLTAKQVGWLAGVAQREAYAHGCKTEQRAFNGWTLNEQGESTGVAWTLNVLRYGAGIFRLSDVTARMAQEDEERNKREEERNKEEESLAQVDRGLDEGTVPASCLPIRNMMARNLGLPEREAVLA